MTPAALVLAGGASRRMGVDKAFMPFAGRPLIEHTIRCLRPQVSHLALNVAHEEEGSKAGRIFTAAFATPCLPDCLPGRQGPLVGILTGLYWAGEIGSEWLLCAPCDCPFLPTDLAVRLISTAIAEERPLVMAASNNRRHPTCSLLHVDLTADLQNYLNENENRKIENWTSRHQPAVVEWPVPGAVLAEGENSDLDPFVNLNTREEFLQAEARANHLLAPKNVKEKPRNVKESKTKK